MIDQIIDLIRPSRRFWVLFHEKKVLVRLNEF